MNEKCYHYVECGLLNVWLANGVDHVDTPYGDGVRIRDVEGLHRCIAQILIDKPEGLTGAEFRFLRRELDLSQRIIAELFGLDERTIRMWECEEGPTKLGDRVIRQMYKEQIDPGSTLQDLFKRLRQLDVEWHESLVFEATDKWVPSKEVSLA